MGGGIARLIAALQVATASFTTEILRVLPGRSTWRDNNGQAWPYIEVRRTRVRPERVAQHDEFQERIRAVRASAGTAPEVRFQVVLGDGFMFVTSRYFKHGPSGTPGRTSSPRRTASPKPTA